MAHREHNKNRRSGGFFLIILGAIVFVTAPTYLAESPELGMLAILFGFVVGGIGFYFQFIKGKRTIK